MDLPSFLPYRFINLSCKIAKSDIFSCKSKKCIIWARAWQKQQTDRCAQLCVWRNLGSLSNHWVHSEDSGQTWQMPRLTWVFDGLVQPSVCSYISKFSSQRAARILFLAYQTRKSKVFAWERNSYLTHVILPMSRIKKKIFTWFNVHWLYRRSRNFVVRLTSFWHHNDVNFHNVLRQHHYVW